MNKEIISRKQGISIIIMYFLSSVLIFGTTEAGKDSWLVVIIAAIMVVPVLFMYIRIMKLHPGKDFFEISTELFGKIAGRILILFYIEFAIHVPALVVNNYVGFITTSSLPETPKYIIAILLVVICMYAARKGIEVIGRWAEIVVFFVLFGIIMLTVLSIPYFDFSNIKPILYNGWKPVLGASFSLVGFQFAELLIVIFMLNTLKSGESMYKVVYSGLTVSALILTILFARVILVLGEPVAKMYYYATQPSVSVINIGEFVQRLDIINPLIVFFNDFIEITFCIIFASKGLTKLFNIREYKKVVVPIGFIILPLSLILYSSSMEEFAWIKYYNYYAFPFQFIFPIIVLIVAEIKNLISKNA